MSPTTVKTATKSSKTSAKPKEPKPKKEKTPKGPQVVFAFRLSGPDRDLIHRAAGPGKASQFAKTILIKEAQKALQANS